MDPVEIRPIQTSDLPAALALLDQPDMDDGTALHVTEARAVLDQIKGTPGHTVFVAESNGAVVGTYALIVIRHLSHRGGRSAVAEDVVVRSDHQGLGVGRTMMAHAAEQAREAGCYKLVLSSNLVRAGAHAFYERLGFERHGVSFRLTLDYAPAV